MKYDEHSKIIPVFNTNIIFSRRNKYGMKTFTGLKGIRRLIELILRKLSEKEEQLEEIEKSIVDEMWKNGGGNMSDIDLSWVATQESVNEIKTEIAEIKATVNALVTKVDAIGAATDPWYGYEVAPDGELANWEYTNDEEGGTVSLTKYKGTQENVVVYDAYRSGNKVFSTKLKKISFDGTSKSTMKSFRVCDRVVEEFVKGTTTSDYPLYYAFSGCSVLEVVDFGNNFDLGTAHNFEYMFNNCTNLHTILGLENWDVSNIISMGYMFKNCSSLTDLSGISKWNAPEIGTINGLTSMFEGCSSLTELDLSSATLGNSTYGSLNMTRMFYNCNSLQSLKLPTSYNNFNTRKCTNMSMMFSDCSVLTELDLTGFMTIKVTNMAMMFRNCPKLTQILVGAGWNTSAVTNNTDMFLNCGVQEVTVA